MKFKLEPQEYRELLQFVEFENINLFKLTADYKPESDYDNEVIVHMKSQILDIERKDNGVFIKTKDTVKLLNKEKKLLAKIEVIFVTEMSLNDKWDDEVFDNFFEIFNNVSLPTIVWPYVRETASTISSKMNIPKVFLPMKKS